MSATTNIPKVTGYAYCTRCGEKRPKYEGGSLGCGGKSENCPLKKRPPKAKRLGES